MTLGGAAFTWVEIIYIAGTYEILDADSPITLVIDKNSRITNVLDGQSRITVVMEGDSNIVRFR
jgi:hypothetical protein